MSTYELRDSLTRIKALYEVYARNLAAEEQHAASLSEKKMAKEELLVTILQMKKLVKSFEKRLI